MTNDPFTSFDTTRPAPGILSGLPSYRRPRSTAGPSRFVTQSHALGVKGASARALAVGAMIAIVLIVVGRRFSG